jgi:hypothetical protein
MLLFFISFVDLAGSTQTLGRYEHTVSKSQRCRISTLWDSLFRVVATTSPQLRRADYASSQTSSFSTLLQVIRIIEGNFEGLSRIKLVLRWSIDEYPPGHGEERREINDYCALITKCSRDPFFWRTPYTYCTVSVVSLFLQFPTATLRSDSVLEDDLRFCFAGPGLLLRRLDSGPARRFNVFQSSSQPTVVKHGSQLRITNDELYKAKEMN